MTDETKEKPDQHAESMEVVEEEVADIKRASRPRLFGALIIVFVSVLIIMIGGLASYYYYTVQRQGSASEQDVRSTWDEVVINTYELTNAFDTVETFDELVSESKNGFVDRLGSTNRALRDTLHNIQGANTFVFSGSSFISKLNIFLDDYTAYLREVQRLTERGSGGLVANIDDTDNLVELSDMLNGSYDNLLIADKNKIIQANLPRELFDMAGNIRQLVEDYLSDKKELDDKELATLQAIGGVATKFMQAYTDRDADAMIIYLTSAAEAEFNPGILEDSSEITSFKILDTRRLSETKVEIDAQINKETPDGNTVSEKRRFVMLNTSDTWLIDSWNTV